MTKEYKISFFKSLPFTKKCLKIANTVNRCKTYNAILKTKIDNRKHTMIHITLYRKLTLNHTNPTKSGSDFSCSKRVSSSCSTSYTRRATNNSCNFQTFFVSKSHILFQYFHRCRDIRNTISWKLLRTYCIFTSNFLMKWLIRVQDDK